MRKSFKIRRVKLIMAYGTGGSGGSILFLILILLVFGTGFFGGGKKVF